MYLQAVESDNEDHLSVLYDLLEERKPHESISHRVMPTDDQHAAFVASQPYTAWYIIINNVGERLGAIYLSKQSEIGLHLFAEHRSKGYGSMALKDLMKRHPRERYLANVNPDNEMSLEFFGKHGFNVCQYTMEKRT